MVNLQGTINSFFFANIKVFFRVTFINCIFLLTKHLTSDETETES